MLFLVVGNGSVDSSSLARSLSRLSSVHQTSHSSCVFDWRVTHFPCARIHNIFHIASLLLLKFQHFPNWRKRRDRISRRKQELKVFFLFDSKLLRECVVNLRLINYIRSNDPINWTIYFFDDDFEHIVRWFAFVLLPHIIIFHMNCWHARTQTLNGGENEMQLSACCAMRTLIMYF